MSKEIFVIGGGESLRGFDFNLLKNKTTIVTNKASFDFPNAEYFITTDYTFLSYIRGKSLYTKWKKTKAKKIFVVNCISDQVQYIDGNYVDTKFNIKYDLSDFDDIIESHSAKGIGNIRETFNSGYNSGFCAFQYALIMGYNPIYLLGIDMDYQKLTHYHGGYGKSRSQTQFNKNLKYYYKHFTDVLKILKQTKPEIEIVSCSKTSKLNNYIKYKNIEDVL